MNNPFDYTPSAECEAAFDALLARIDTLRESDNPEDVNFCNELSAGKMLGVLIADDTCGRRHTLYAFSGQLGTGGFYHEGFVGPVFDYLQPDGYFKTHEAMISRQNAEISAFETHELQPATDNCSRISSRHQTLISELKEKYRISKQAREARRLAGNISDSEQAEMIRQSQYEKAELKRLQTRLSAEIAPHAEHLAKLQAQLQHMKSKRQEDSQALQTWLFSNFRVLNARGESRSLLEIFAEYPIKTPPSGAGECCGPKLLQAAYQQGLRPIAIAEYWYGQPKGGQLRIHRHHYMACRGKCLPILTWMLSGLDVTPPIDSDTHSAEDFTPTVIFENQWFCVVNKPSGMLSVPGKGSRQSVQQWLEQKYGSDRQIRMAHRLDQDTSGLLVACFGNEAYKLMQTLFATRQVEKVYMAELQGDYSEKGIPAQGRITLPIAPDWIDRPRQKVDFDQGKECITDYEFQHTHADRSRILFYPHTGRTHQLRITAASPHGLGMPIIGDRLYGNTSGRLRLHAMRLSFTFPLDSRRYTFEAPLQEF